MKVEVYGKPNFQRFAETWAALIADRNGMEVVSGSVKVELQSEKKEVNGNEDKN